MSLELLRADMQSQLAALGAEVAELRAEIHGLRTELPENSATKLRAEVKSQQPDTSEAEPASEQLTDIQKERLDPPDDKALLTYAQAYELIGGDTQLAGARSLREKQNARISNPALDAEVKQLLPLDYQQRIGFSTALINQPFVSNLDSLYVKSQPVYQLFRQRVEALASKTGGKAHVPVMKGQERATMKAQFKYLDELGGVAWYRLTDLIRGTLEYADISSMYAALEAVVDLFQEHNVHELNDRYCEPMDGGYRDLQLVVSIDDIKCELQLTTGPMLLAKKTTGHRDFEVLRELRAAVAQGSEQRCEQALRWGAANLASGAGGVRTLLRTPEAGRLFLDAAAAGHASILCSLLTHGINVNGTDEQGNTALHLAAFGGHERSLWALMDMGKADPAKINHKQQTALVSGYLMLHAQPSESRVRALMTLSHVVAMRQGLEALTKAKQQAGDEIKAILTMSRPLVDAAADGDLTRVTALLRGYAHPDSKAVDGTTALIAAVMAASSEAAAVASSSEGVVKVLVQFGASVDATDSAGNSALDWASHYGAGAVVKLLQDQKPKWHEPAPVLAQGESDRICTKLGLQRDLLLEQSSWFFQDKGLDSKDMRLLINLLLKNGSLTSINLARNSLDAKATKALQI